MKRFLTFILIIILAFSAYFVLIKKQNPFSLEETQKIINKITMNISSSAFGNNQSIPEKYTCVGESINPPLKIRNIPGNTKSLALIMDDPDAPSGTFVHWILFDIDPSTVLIQENSVPDQAVVGTNSTGQATYVGPCPPDGEHRYFFKLYALNTMLGVDQATTKDDLLAAMSGHILQNTELVGKFKK